MLLNVAADGLNWFADKFSGTSLPTIEIPDTTPIKDALRFVFYIFPSDTVIGLIVISSALLGLRIAIAIYKLLPFT